MPTDEERGGVKLRNRSQMLESFLPPFKISLSQVSQFSLDEHYLPVQALPFFYFINKTWAQITTALLLTDWLHMRQRTYTHTQSSPEVGQKNTHYFTVTE